jgi:hypothetical protein
MGKITRSDVDRLFTIIFIFVAVIFLLIFRWLRKNGNKENGLGGAENNGLVKERYLIIAAAVLLRLIFAGVIEGFPYDMSCFKSWSYHAADDFFGLYSKGEGFFLDYPPGYMYILFLLGKIRDIFSIPSESAVFTIIIKLPAMAADVVSGVLLYKLSEGRFNKRYRLFIMSVYLFNPAAFFISTIWGQIDSVTALLALAAAIYMAKEKYELSAVFFALGVLLKPQGIIFLPVLFFEFLWVLLKKRQIKRLFIATACFAGTFIAGVLPFSAGKEPLWIVGLYMNTLQGYDYATMNAYNFFALLGANMRGGSDTFMMLKYSTWGYIFIVAFTVLTGVVSFLYHFKRERKDQVSKDEQPIMKLPESEQLKGKRLEPEQPVISNVMPFIGTGAILLGVTTFGPKMHERYFFPALLLLLAVYCLSGNVAIGAAYTLVSVSGFFNVMLVFSMYYTDNLENLNQSPTIYAISALTVFSAVALWAYIVKSKGRITDGS